MAEDIVKITDHQDQAEARLGGQYKSKPRIRGLIRSMGRETQELEDVLFQYLDARKIRSAIGAQLDDLGLLVGADRQGFTDDFYRILIFVKIAENFSEGQPDPLINAFKLMTNAQRVQYINHGGANLSLISDGQLAPGVSATFVRQQLERLLAAGVSIDALSMADPDEPFVLGGGGSEGKGLGTLNDPTIGGRLSKLI